MCIPTNVVTGVSSAIGLAGTISDYKSNQKMNEYKTQIALNNVENNKYLASQQIQQGVESARLTKIKGISSASSQMAKNASSGFDVNSATNLYGVEDIFNSAEMEVNNTREEYALKAQNYINNANNQILSLNSDLASNANSKFKTGMNILGTSLKVSNDWFKGDEIDL